MSQTKAQLLDGKSATIQFTGGSASAPPVSFTGDTNTGIYSPGADQVAISTNGTKRIEIQADGDIDIDNGGVFYDATNNRLAIGTTSPNNKFTCQDGDILVRSEVTTGSANSYHIGFSATATGGIAATISSARENANEASALTFNNWNGSAFGERARIDSSGRLLVGTSSSSAEAKFIVQGGATAFGGAMNIQRSVTTASAGSTIGFINFTNSSNDAGAIVIAEGEGTWSAGTSHPTRLVFSTTADGASSPTERMRIDNTGGILFGRTVLGNIGDSLGIAFGGGGAGYAYFERSGGPGIYVRRATSTGNAVEFYQGTNTYVGSISVTASATAYNTSSDYRLKENVKLVTDGINRLQQLKPSRFNFIADPDTVVDGFIAHEVQAVVPEAITGEKDAVDEDGNPVYQGIDQSKLVPLLTAALQEAIGEIESLKARVATLETA